MYLHIEPAPPQPLRNKDQYRLAQVLAATTTTSTTALTSNAIDKENQNIPPILPPLTSAWLEELAWGVAYLEDFSEMF